MGGSLPLPPLPPPLPRELRNPPFKEKSRQKAWDGREDGEGGHVEAQEGLRASAGRGGVARRARASCPARPAGAGASQVAGEAVGRKPGAGGVGREGLGRRLGPGARPLASFPSPGAMCRECEPSSSAAAKWVTKSAWWEREVNLERMTKVS